MKNIICIIMVLTFIFAGCSSVDEPVSEIPNIGETPELIEPSLQETNEFDFSEYDDVIDEGFMYILIKTNGIREYARPDENYIYHISEVPNEQIWFLMKDGRLLNEEPYEAYDFINNIDYYDEPGFSFYGFRYGKIYGYFYDDTTGTLTEEAPKGFESTEHFGYSVYDYYWNDTRRFYGITAPDGSVFAEPIYKEIYIPCKNRFVLVNGTNSSFGAMVTTIYDENKNIINDSFNYIYFNNEICPDGYIGVAFCGNANDGETIIRYDKDGNPMEPGYYFVDGSGNIIHGPFESFSVNGDNLTIKIHSGEDIIKVIYHSGEGKEFPVKDILITD